MFSVSLISQVRNLLLATLVVATNLHCLWESANVIQCEAALARFARQHETVPFGFPQGGCEDESGCMCRGATLATAVDVSELAPALLVDCVVELPFAFHSLSATSCMPSSLGGREAPPPLSGKMLRTHYVSLLS